MKVCEPLDIFSSIMECHLSTVKVSFKNVQIDSRKIGRSDIFFGIKGKRFDGNRFSMDAIEKGAAFVVMDDKECFYSLKHPGKILVRNTENAFVEFGKYIINKYKGIKIAVTGSAGKTSTKSMMENVLGQKYRTYASFKNFNNRLGVAFSAANLDLNTDYAIFELGTNSKGEIEKLSSYVEPDMAVITNIGMSHIGNFGSKKDIAKEKLSIVNGLSSDKKNVPGCRLYLHETCRDFWDDNITQEINSVEDFCYFGAGCDNDIYLSDFRYEDGLYFEAVYRKEAKTFLLNHIYKHFAENALSAIALGYDLSIDYEDIFKGISSFTPVEGRGGIIDVSDRLCLIDDTYNASFESVLCSLNDLHDVNWSEKYAVIGEMAEIDGYEDIFYDELYSKSEEFEDINFNFVGQSYSRFSQKENVSLFMNKQEFKKKNDIKEGLVLIKASRGEGFEEIIKYFTEECSSAV